LIREGGSIPTVPWLEDFFNCPAIHFPMGQSSDQAHLKNERIRLRNLQAGKSIIRNFFIQLSAKKSSQSSSELDRDKVFEPKNPVEQEDGSRKTSLVVINNSLLNIESESDGDSLNQFKISDIEDV
jgi:di- and tripeptidase